MATRAFGCIHDAPSVRGSHTLEQVLGASAGAPPDTLDLHHLIDAIRNQGNRPTCCAFGTGQAIQLTAKQNGHPNAIVPAALHLFAQAIGITHSDGVDGTTIGAAIAGAQTGGIMDESLLPYDPAKVYQDIDLDLLQKAVLRIGLKAHRVIAVGDDIDMAVKVALSTGKGVMAGIDVDQPFEDWAPGEVYPGLTQKRIGSHCMAILDFPAGLPRWVGSYGKDWAEAGYITTTWDVVRKAGSLWIVDYAP